MVIRDKYEDQVRQHYEQTGEHLLIAEQHTGAKDRRPQVVSPESVGTGKVVHEFQREVKVPRWI